MRARNLAVLQSNPSLSAPAPKREVSRFVPVGPVLGSGAIFERAAAQYRDEAWTFDENKRLKAAQHAADQALFAAAFEKTTLESVCCPVPFATYFQFSSYCFQFQFSSYCFQPF